MMQQLFHAVLSFNHAIKAHDILKEKGIKGKSSKPVMSKKLDSDALLDACKTGIIITCEDHNSATGIGSRVANWLVDNKAISYFKKTRRHKLRFIRPNR